MTPQKDNAVFRHKLVLINVNRTGKDPKIALLDAVRYSWKISPKRAETADYVLAVIEGTIVGAFEADEWLLDTAENFPECAPKDRPWGIRIGRWAFRGREAPHDIKALYVNKAVPAELRKHGAANPIRYVGM
jgi:hypothetical protein